MRAYDCPQCGGTVAFESSITIFATCPYCGNMIIRRDMDLESLGNQAALPPDQSPLQIGTTGVFEDQTFTLVGRVRVGYREGTWTEWCADFGGGRWGWIAEAQGYYMASFEIEVPSDFPGAILMAQDATTPDGLALVGLGLNIGRESMPVGKKVTIGDIEYKVRDVKQTDVLGSAGELPFVASPGRSAISADLGAPGMRFANAEYSEKGIRLFVGKYCRFGDLEFGNLRPVPGWTTDQIVIERNQSAALSCPQCGAAVVLKAGGLSMTAACTHCGSLIDTSNPVWKLIEGAVNRNLLKPKIPIGKRGKFDGVEYECIGCMLRVDGAGDHWFEYLLYNPFQGFKWLVNYNGHWNWVTVLLEPPQDGGGGLVPDWPEFRLYSAGWAEVVDVIGEFYWKVRRHERTQVEDYISPPRIASCETYPDLDEETWSLGKYMTEAEVFAAFALPGARTGAEGVYPNQPNPYRAKGKQLGTVFTIGVLLLIMVQLGSTVGESSDPVFKTRVNFDATKTNRTVITPAFEIKNGHSSAVTLRMDAAVKNGWVVADVALINSVTKETKSVGSQVSYYEGYDEGPWSEGSQHDEQIIPQVGPGKYYLRIEPSADEKIQQLPILLEVIPGGHIWSNFFLGLVALVAYPGYFWIRSATFESARWENSSMGSTSASDGPGGMVGMIGNAFDNDDD